MTNKTRRNTPDLDAEIVKAHEIYSTKRPKSLGAFNAATSVMPGGNTRTVLFHDPYPFQALSGEGAWLTDVDGNRVLNLLGEYTAGLFGHDHPAIRSAVSEALSGGLNLGAHNTYEPRFAAAVCQRFPSIKKVRFTNSGTEANLMAVTAARTFTGRSKVLVFEGGYHGGVFLFKPGVITNAPYPWIKVRYNDTAAAIEAIADNVADLAAVLVEPMQGSGGCIAADAGFLSALRSETEKAGSLLIFDEVMTSRLGQSGAQGLYGIMPDLTTLGKWIGGGMSFGGFGGRDDVMDLYDPRRPDAIAHAGTFNNNVLTMAAGITALEEIYTTSRAVEFTKWGDNIRKQLKDIAAEIDVPITITGMGTLMNLHPTGGPVRHFGDVATLDDRLRELLFLDLLDTGYYTARRGFIALSLALTDSDISGFYQAFRNVLEQRSDLLKFSETG